MPSDHAWTVDEIAHDLDMLVFSLEQPAKEDATGQVEERVRLRKKLESLRDRLRDLRDALK